MRDNKRIALFFRVFLFGVFLACSFSISANAVQKVTVQSINVNANTTSAQSPPPPQMEGETNPGILLQQGRQLAAEGKNDQAALVFIRIYTERPDHPFAPSAMVEAARAMLASGKPSDAVRILEAATEKYPENRDVLNAQQLLTSIYVMLGEPEKGVGALKLLMDKGTGQEAVEATRKLVELYFDIGRKYEGETLAEKYLAKYPGDTQFLYLLADSSRKNEDYETALSIFEKLMVAQPQNSPFENEYFSTLKDAGKLDDEISRIENKYEKNPDNMELAHRLKRIYLWDKRSLDALLVLEKIVEREPENFEDAVVLARQYYANQWKSKATALLQKVIAARPNYEVAWREMGEIYFKEKQLDEAMSAWKRAAAFNPDDEASYRRMANYLMPRYLYAELTVLYEEGRKRLGNPLVFAHDLASLYTSQMMREKALGEFINIVLMQPGDLNSRRQLVEAALADGMDESGPAMLEAAITRNRSSWSLMIGLLNVLMERGREEEGFLKMREYAEATGASFDFLIELAGSRSAAGSHGQAAKIYEEAGRYAGSKRPFCLLQEGRSWLTYGDSQKAVDVFKTLVEESPEEPGTDEAVMHIAQVHTDNGEHEEARKWYIRLVTDYPASAWRDDALVMEARAAFLSGDFAAAADSFQALATMPGARGRLDEIIYYSAMTSLFAFDFEEAGKRFAKIIDQYPDSRWVNDALDKILFLQDAGDIDGIRMQAIVSAEKEWIKGDRDAAESILSGLVITLTDGNMKGHAALRLGAIRKDSGDTEGAVEVLEKITGDAYSTELRARALYLAGELFMNIKQGEKALKKFQELTMQFPNSYWSGRARRLAGTIVLE